MSRCLWLGGDGAASPKEKRACKRSLNCYGKSNVHVINENSTLLHQGCCASFMSSWSTNGFFSYSKNYSDILISMTSSDLRCDSSTFKQKSSNPSTILAKSPIISSTSTSLHSTDMSFLLFSVLDYPTITPHRPNLSPQGCLLWLPVTTICKEDIRVPSSFLLVVGIKHGVCPEKMAKLLM
jgi:hypothetical protein